MRTPAPVLAGVLTDFALADALQLLELGTRSGVLVVDGGPFGAGRVFVDRGRVSAVVTREGDLAGDVPAAVADAVADLLDIPRGRWTFHPSELCAAGVEPPRHPTNATSIGMILVEAARRRDERTRAAGQVLDDADVVEPDLRDDADNVGGHLSALHLRVLGAVDGVRDVRGVADALRCDVARVRDAVSALRALGLVRVVRAGVRVGASL